MSSQKVEKGKKRSSLPASLAAQSQQMWPPAMWNPAFMNPFPMGMGMNMGMMQQPMGPPGSATATSSGCSSMNKRETTKHPWDSSSGSESDDDFVPLKKTKTTSKAAPTSSTQGEKKRKPGRPKKESTLLAEDKLIIDGYPSVEGKDEIAFEAKDECRNCRLWKGRLALKPCGHAKYCFSCLNKFKTDATTMKRAGKCLSDNCYAVVKGWFILFNVSS